MATSDKREYLVEKIRNIVQTEKFKVDAYFLCGAASGLPNDGLQKACEKYLAAVDAGEATEEAKAVMLTEMEKVLSTEPEIKVVGDMNDNRNVIREVVDHREFL